MTSTFIAIEGIDGSGLTTQSKKLIERLKAKGITASYTKEPTRSTLGLLLWDVINGELPSFRRNEVLSLLFAADRFVHLYGCLYTSTIRNCIIGRLLSGETMVSDRYKYSSYAYQSTESPIGSVPLEFIKQVNWFAPPPHILVYLDAEPEEAWRRLPEARYSMQLYEHVEQLQRVKEQFDKIIESLSRKPEYCPGDKPAWGKLLSDLSKKEPADIYPQDICYPAIIIIKEDGRPIDSIAKDIEAAVLSIISEHLLGENLLEGWEKERIKESEKEGLLNIYIHTT